ncbi:MAG: hypothetical protein JKX78_07650 [Alteromonadaceae bacterium]|nr:hypothetical protein [Alteromonadaceae bacterium]
MSFFKSLLLAIFITLFLTYVLGSSMVEMFDINIYMGDSLIEPLKAISISALVILLLVLVAVAIVMSVFGGIIFVSLLVLGSLAMVAIGVFWPVLLIALVIWLFARDKQPQQA